MLCSTNKGVIRKQQFCGTLQKTSFYGYLSAQVRIVIGRFFRLKVGFVRRSSLPFYSIYTFYSQRIKPSSISVPLPGEQYYFPGIKSCLSSQTK